MALLALLLVATRGTSGGRELYRQDLGPGSGGTAGGWTQREGAAAPGGRLSLAGVTRGYASFDLRRLPAAAPEAPGTVFELLDREDRRVFRLLVAWSSVLAPGRAALYFAGDGADYYRNGLGLWSPLVVLDRGVDPGQAIRVDLTWDDEAKEVGLYVDGRPQEPRPGSWDRDRRAFAEDARRGINAESLARGEAPPFEEKPFGYFLERVRRIAMGRHGGLGPKAPRNRAVLTNAAVENLSVGADDFAGTLHEKGYDARNLRGSYGKGEVLLTWAPPEIHGISQRYLVYRRAGAEGDARFQRLTAEPLRDLRYVDATAKTGETYRYSVTSLYGDRRGGTLEGKYPPEVTVTAAPIAVESVAAEKAAYGPGQELAVVLRGTPDLQARFTIRGLLQDMPMAEVDDGVYLGKVRVPPGVDAEAAPIVGVLTDAASGASATLAGPPVRLDARAPEPVPRILAAATWPGEIQVSWEASPSPDVDRYLVYRAEDGRSAAGVEPYESLKALSLADKGVTPGIEYRYTVLPVDRAGNRGPGSEAVAARALPGDGPRIAAITLEPSGRPARPGEAVAIEVRGQGGAAASVDVGDRAKALHLEEEARTGRYRATYTVTEQDVGPTRAGLRVVAHLQDDFGASTLAGPELVVAGRDLLDDRTPPVIAAADHDAARVVGSSRRLVAGDTVTVSMDGEPGGQGRFDVQGVASGVPLAEGSPGHYSGTYTVKAGDAGDAAPVVVRLADEAGNEATLGIERPLAFDTRVRLTVEPRDALLPADGKSQTRLTARAADANGGPVRGHELALTLSTTREYTGVVGGGRLEGREALPSDEDNLEVRWGGATDRAGEVRADYTAGTAAKTALVVAKDLATGDAGVGWLNTYVASTVAVELVPRVRKGAPDRASLRLSAEPAKLTADGRSTSRLRAWLAAPDGSPRAGAPVRFALAGGNGRLRVLRGTTDAGGLAEAEYRAGTALGTVTVTATAEDEGVTASVQIVLMSDAPARIDLAASPQRLTADGMSQATVSIRVSDVHGNPNQDVSVRLSVPQGSGRLSAAAVATDRNGEARISFTAGTKPGTAVVEARHTSRPPTEEELRRAFGTVFVPRLFEGQERDRLKLTEWLVKPGDEVEKGRDLAVLEARRGRWTLAAPAAGVFVREERREGDEVRLGDTVGYVEIDPEVWEESYRSR